MPKCKYRGTGLNVIYRHGIRVRVKVVKRSGMQLKHKFEVRVTFNLVERIRARFKG